MTYLNKKDTGYLQTTLTLAKKALGKTFPNPMVGAVIVKNGRIIGQGYHHKAGRHHAEIEALKNLTASAKGATLYVNLEPCSHFGKTPPCVNAIIKNQIAKVVCCTLDPNPKVNGKGIKRLRLAGIKTSVGGLAHEAKLLNEAFFTFQQKHRPFITVKFASSLDGKIATYTNDSKWITNNRARLFSRKIRGQHQAVLVGINTIIHGNPNLGGMPNQSDPLRIIFDSALKINLNSHALRNNNILIFTTKLANKIKYNKLIKLGVKIFVCPGLRITLPIFFNELIKRKVLSVFVEGGGDILGSFFDAGVIDKAYVFQAPILIGGKGAITAIGGLGAKTISKSLKLTKIEHKFFGDNTLVSGYISK